MNRYVVVPLFFSGEMYLITGKNGLQALFSLFLFSIFMYITDDLSDFLASPNLQPHVVFIYESARLISSHLSFFQVFHTLRQAIKNRLIIDRITRNFQPV